MKFLTQTKLHDPEKGIRGNCMMACYAGYFDFEINEVPAIEELFDGPPGFWIQALDMWLRDYVHHETRYIYKDGKPADPYHLTGYNGYYLVAGMSPRNVLHQVIFKGGEIVHDPHPSRAGIGEPTEYVILVPLYPQTTAKEGEQS